MKTGKKNKAVQPARLNRGNFNLSARLGSFRYAFRGLWLLVRREHNAWIHLAATLIVLAASYYFEISEWEWCAIIFAVGFVWTTEALNTALEYLADALCPEKNVLVGQAKDLAAAGVLLAALTAVAIGLIVLGPYVTEWWSK